MGHRPSLTHFSTRSFVLATPASLIGALIAALTPHSALAEPATTDDSVERVVVTANRVEQPLSRVGNSVTLIGSDAIVASQQRVVSDLLTRTPGISASRNGGLGATTALAIRGAEPDQTVVLIDGVKLNDPSSTGGGFNFAHLLTTDFMRIEVLRGPQSTLWGSQAIGGVINIVTPVPQGPLSGSLLAEGGSYGSANVQARAEAGGERVAWRLAGKYLTTDGVSAFDKDLGGRERDGYDNAGANARVLVKITDSITAEARSTWTKDHLNYDGFGGPTFALMDTRDYANTEELVAYAGITATAFGGRLNNRFGFAYTDTDRENFNPDSSVRQTFDASGRNERWEYQGTLLLTDRTDLVFGVESEHSNLSTVSPDEFNPNPVPLEHGAQLNSAYAQVSVSPIDSLTLTGGLRYDDHQTFGSETTGSASAAWRATQSTIVRASYGEGFKAPTLFQLFSDFGNEALAPEQARAWDFGVEQHLLSDALSVRATYFERDTDNMINFVSCFGSTDPRCPARPAGFYDNVAKTAADGIELELIARIDERLRLTANYTNLDAVNRAPGRNFDKQLQRRPSEAFSGEAAYEWPIGLTTAVALTHAGRSYDDAANTIALDGYTIVDVRAALTIGARLEVFGRIENVFDEDYATTARYGSIGRGAYLGVRQSF